MDWVTPVNAIAWVPTCGSVTRHLYMVPCVHHPARSPSLTIHPPPPPLPSPAPYVYSWRKKPADQSGAEHAEGGGSAHRPERLRSPRQPGSLPKGEKLGLRTEEQFGAPERRAWDPSPFLRSPPVQLPGLLGAVHAPGGRAHVPGPRVRKEELNTAAHDTIVTSVSLTTCLQN